MSLSVLPNNALLEKIPPQNLDAEISTLGSMLIERDAIARVIDVITREDFYKESHKCIFECITTLFDRGQPVDLITVTEELRRKSMLDQVGGVLYITSLANTVPTAANAEHYAKIVKQKSILRSLVSAGTKIAELGYESASDVDNALDEAEQLIFRISQKKNSEGYAHIRSILMSTFERLEKLYSNRGGITGITTGFKDLDDYTSGFQPSDLIILAARPSVGKTAFALNIAQNAAMRQNIPVAIFSLEMAREQLAHRMLCSVAEVDSQRMRTGYLTEADWPKLSLALGRLSEAPILIDDTAGISVLELRAKCRRIKSEHGLGMVIIDYLQLMQGRGKIESRQQEVSEISRSLKALARELEVPIVALSQLSRAVEQRVQKTPTLADLRESGSIEQDADIVMFLYREDYYDKETEKKNIIDLIIAKQRNGPTGTIEFLFQKEFSKFRPLEKIHKAEQEA